MDLKKIINVLQYIINWSLQHGGMISLHHYKMSSEAMFPLLPPRLQYIIFVISTLTVSYVSHFNHLQAVLSQKY